MNDRPTSTLHFIQLLLAGSIFLFYSQVKAQVSCDSIVIGSIHYSGVDEQIIALTAWSETNNCVHGPIFILYDMNGDTLATEIPGFFCLGIGTPQTHSLAVMPGATLLVGTQDVVLELFSGSTQGPICTWDLTIDLCPADSCIEAQIYMIDHHDMLTTGEAYWSINDLAGTTSWSGIFEFDGVATIDFDTLCLPPGSYSFYVSPFSSIDVMDSITLGVRSILALDPGVNTITLNDSTAMGLQFTWYRPCADLDNAISEEVQPTLLLSVVGDMLSIRNEKGNPLGAVQLISVDGRVARSLSIKADRVDVPIQHLAKGIYIVRAYGSDNIGSTQRVYLP